MSSVNQGVAKKRNKKRLFLIILSCLLVFGGAVYGFYRYTFPYGSSHCCIAQIGLALRMYATDNDGKFPAGGATPEASLAFLGKGGYLGGDNTGAYLLRGKTVPLEVTQKAMQQGTLNSNSTGWHYVEGLRETDNPQIAIVWDKVGLGHNGQRLKDGGHEVALVDGSHTFVTGSKWPEFLEKQKQLLARRTDREKNGIPLLQARIKMPDGQIVDRYEGNYTLEDTTKSSDGNGHGVQSGSGPQLSWFHLYQQNASITYQLSLPSLSLRSKPVNFQITNHSPSTNLIIFEMEKY